MSLKRDLDILCEAALNEGGGAGVNFEFSNADFTPIPDISEYKYTVENLRIESYEDAKRIENAGTIELNIEDLKDQIINFTDGLTVEDKAKIEITEIELESVSDYMYSAGWTRASLDKTGFGNNDEDKASVRAYYTIDGDEYDDYYECSYLYIPSEEAIDEYSMLDEIDDDFDESLNESVDERTEIQCRVYARMLEKINEKFRTLIGTFKVEPLVTDKYELGLKRGYGKYDFKFVSDDAFLPLKNKSLEEQAEYLKGLILGKE